MGFHEFQRTPNIVKGAINLEVGGRAAIQVVGTVTIVGSYP